MTAHLDVSWWRVASTSVDLMIRYQSDRRVEMYAASVITNVALTISKASYRPSWCLRQVSTGNEGGDVKMIRWGFDDRQALYNDIQAVLQLKKQR